MRHLALYITFPLLCFFATSTTAYSQQRSLVDKIVKQIQKKGIDTIITFYRFEGTPLSYEVKKNYILGLSTYIIWKEKEAYFIQKVSACFDSIPAYRYDTAFVPIKTIESKAYQYLIDNIDSISGQELKMGLIKNKDNGKEKLSEVKYTHDGVGIINFYAGTFIMVKKIYLSQLDNGIILNVDGSLRSINESINYEYNINSQIYNLYSLLILEILAFENKILLPEQ